MLLLSWDVVATLKAESTREVQKAFSEKSDYAFIVKMLYRTALFTLRQSAAKFFVLSPPVLSGYAFRALCNRL